MSEIITVPSVFGLFGPPGLLGIYVSVEAATTAGDYWAEGKGARCLSPWAPDDATPGAWQREIQDRNRLDAPAELLRVKPVPLNGKPRTDW